MKLFCLLVRKSSVKRLAVRLCLLLAILYSREDCIFAVEIFDGCQKDREKGGGVLFLADVEEGLICPHRILPPQQRRMSVVLTGFTR